MKHPHDRNAELSGPRRLSRRDFVKRAAASVGAAGLWGCQTAPTRKTSARPNILFIMTDQESTSLLGCYGNGLIRTPARDAIARGGIRFENHYTAAYPCSPSRATMITGRYAHNHNIVVNEIPLEDNIPALGGILAAEGYDTLWVGKSHLSGQMYIRDGEDYTHFELERTPDGFAWETKPGGRGEDLPIGGFRRCVGGWKHFREYLKTTDLPEHIKNNRYVGGHNDAPSTTDDQHAYSLLGEDHHMAHFFADETIKALGEASQTAAPFCYVLSFYGPHHPVAPPQPWDTIYAFDRIPLPPNFEAPLDDKPLGQRVSTRNIVRTHWNQEQVKDYIRRYYGYVSYLDAQIERVLAALERNGQAENTIVVFTADHGDMLGQFGMVHKMTDNAYDTLMKVPCMIRWPRGIPAGLVHQGLCSSVDLMPTLLELSGVKVPASVDGRSMKNVVLGRADTAREEVFTDVMNKGYMVRRGPWKYVLNVQVNGKRSRRDLDELYNLDEDPYETTNLAYAPEHQALVTELQRRIFAWLEETKHPYRSQIGKLAVLAPPRPDPLIPVLKAFEDLGQGRFRLEYAWQCNGEVNLGPDTKDVAAIELRAPGRFEQVWQDWHDTSPAAPQWQSGRQYSSVFVGTLPGDVKPGEYELRLGIYNPPSAVLYANGYESMAPVATVTVTKEAGAARMWTTPWRRPPGSLCY